MKSALIGALSGIARRALSLNWPCPMMHNGERPFGGCLYNREVYHAYNSSIGGFDRGRLPAMAGE